MRPYRREKVARVVRRVVSEAIAQRIQDPRVAPLTTVTRVEMTGDLLVAKVYLSVQGAEAAERCTLAALQHAAGFIQRMVAAELPIRHCPELRFQIDEAVKGTRRTMELLAENRRNEPEVFESQDEADQTEPNEAQGTDQEDNDVSESYGVGE